MKSTTWMYAGGGVLILISLCFMGYGVLNLIASTADNAQSNWMGLGTGLLCVGLLMLGGGVALIVSAVRKNKQETVQNVTYQVDLPGDTKIEQMKCRSCGGTLTSDNIKLVNGAPMVTCPYCNSVYQLTEEPKW